MIVVIQCAATKRPHAGRFRTSSGWPVLFVADPLKTPASNCLYARPDDTSDEGPTWRELLLRYNDQKNENPFGLLAAFDLYENDTYRHLVDRFGLENTYILSAGWGLIKGAFLTPAYNITFAAQADAYKRRRRKDLYQDFCMLPSDTAEPIFFFGGQDYVPLFSWLTRSISAPKTVFHYSAMPPVAPGCSLQRFASSNPRKWPYECATAFIEKRRTAFP